MRLENHLVGLVLFKLVQRFCIAFVIVGEAGEEEKDFIMGGEFGLA